MAQADGGRPRLGKVPAPSITRDQAVEFVASGEQRVFRILWFFLPETSIGRSRRFQYLLASTFLSDGGRDAMKYGALVAVTRSSGSSMDPALVGVASVLPTALFGLYGGAIADSLPKRTALAAVYALQALMCFIVPFYFGTDLGAVLALIFAINLLGQVSTPDEQSIAPLVASDEQLASATSLLSLASNVGTFFGTALLAPILLKVLGVGAVFAVAGIMLLLATVRILRVRTRQDDEKIVYKRPVVHLRSIIRWLLNEPAVATMILVGVIGGTATVVLQTLAPRYVQSVLGLDPADAVYVFAPSSVGLVLALAAAPWLLKHLGERHSALAGFIATSTSLCLLGLVQHGIVPYVDPINPFRLLNTLGLHLGGAVRTASFLVMPLGFGVALTTMAVQTYINRRVPLSHQGRTFALQSVLKNGLCIIPLLVLGSAASLVGVDNILVVSPFVLVGAAFLLVRVSERFTGHTPVRSLDVLSSFWRNGSDSEALTTAQVEAETGEPDVPPGGSTGTDKNGPA